MATYNELRDQYGLSNPKSGTSGGSEYSKLRQEYGLTGQSGKTTSYNDLRSQYGLTRIDDNPEEYINSYFRNVDQFYRSGTDRFNSLGFGDASGSYKDFRDTASQYRIQENNIRYYLKNNEANIDPTAYDSIIADLDSYGSYISSLQDQYRSVADYYGQWGSQEEYDTWMQDYEAQQEQERQYDLYQQNKKRLQELQEERDRRTSNPGMNAYTGGIPAPSSGSPYGAALQYTPPEQEETDQGLQILDADIARFQAEVDRYEKKIWGSGGRVADALGGRTEEQITEEMDAIRARSTQNVQPGMNSYTSGGTAQDSGTPYAAALQYKPLTEDEQEMARLQSEKDWLDYVNKYVGRKYDDNFSGQYSANRVLGRLSQDSSLYWNAYLDDPTEENRRMAETADELIERFSIVNSETLADDGTLPWISKDLANYMPQLWDQLKYKAVGTLAGAALTMGNPWGAKAGYVAGSAMYGYQTMRGAAFRELIKAGMDEDTARAAANDEAVISSLIEAGDAVLDIAMMGAGSVIDLVTKGGATAVKNWLSKITGKNVVTRLLTNLGKYALNAGGEYLEESTQEAVSIANQERDTSGIMDLAARALSTYLLIFNADSEEEQDKQAQMREAGMGGLRLGLMLGGGEMAGNAAVGSAVGNIRAEMEVGELRPKLRELTAKTLELNPNDKNALRVQTRMEQGKNVSGMDIYKMLLANEEAAAKKDVEIVREAVAARLTELGEQGNIEAISEAIARQAAGKELLRKDFAAIRDSKYAQQIVRELNLLGSQEKQSSFDNKTEGAQWRDKVNTLRQQSRDYAMDLSGNIASPDVQRITNRLIRDGFGDQEAAETARKLAEAGKIYGKQADDFTNSYLKGQSVEQYRMAFANIYQAGKEGASRELIRNYGQGLTDAQKEIAYLAGQKAGGNNKALQSIQEDDTLDVNAEGKTIRTDTNEDIEPTGFESVGENGTLSTKGGQSVSIRSVAFASYDDAVLYNTIAKVASSPNIANTLLRQFRAQDSLSAIDFAAGLMEAYEAGQLGEKTALELKDAEFAGKLTTGQREAVYNRGKRAAYQKAYQRQQDVKKKSGGKKEGKLHFDRDGRKFDDLRESSLSVMDTISKALGVDIYVYESFVNEKGQRVYLSDRGEKKAPNGYYDPEDGSIHIDLNAGQDGKGTMLFTVAHELTHFIKDWSSVKYRALADALVKKYQKRGVTVSELVDNQIRKAEQNGREMSRPEAFDEVVADSMESMLSDENAAAFLEKLAKRDKGLKEKIVSWLKELAAKLKNAMSAYKDVEPDSPEGKMVAQMEDFRKEIMGIYTSALVDAGENFRENGGNKNTTREGRVRYSFGITQEDIDDYVDGAYSHTNSKDYQKYATVSERLYLDVLPEIDIQDYAHALRDNDIRHIRNSHGEGTNEKYPVTIQDIKNIPWIVENYDKVYVVRKKNGSAGLMYVKAMSHGLVYYLEQATTKYGNENLLVNKQMIKTGISDIPDLPGLKDAITKKQSETEFLNDLKKAQQVYAQSVYQSHSKDSIRNPEPVVNNESPKIFSDRDITPISKADIQKAESHFGTTRNYDIAGYLLTDGKMLDFSGKHWGDTTSTYRQVDHRDIWEVWEHEDSDGTEEMVNLIGNGNIRLMPESGGINLAVKPNAAQVNELRGYINHFRGEVIVDIDRVGGDTIQTLSYNKGTSSSKILSDIKDYFDSGKLPEKQSEISQFIFSDRDPTADATRAALEKENGKLREDVSRLRELLRLQGKVTGGTVMKPSSVEAAAKWLNKYAGAKADVKELSRMLNDFYRFIATDKDYGWEDVHEHAMVIAKYLQDNVQIKPQMSDYARDVLRDIRGIKITLDDSQRAEVEYQYGSYDAFRKAAFGNVTFVKEGGIPLDSQWKEWASLYPGTFDSGITANDQPQALMDIIDAMRNSDTTVTEYAYNRESIAQDLAVAVYDSYWRVDALRTVADRDQRKINDLTARREELKGTISEKNAQIKKLRAEHRNEMDSLKEERNKTVAALKQKRQEDMKKLRTDYRKKLEDTRTRYQESREKAVDSRNRAKMRKRIRGVVRELNKLFTRGTKERNVKEGMRDFVASALASAEVLFTDFYSTDDMIRNGVGVTLTENESKLLNRAMDLLAELDSVPDALTEDGMAEWMNREQILKKELSYVKSKLKDVFTRERTRIEGTTAASVLAELADAYQEIQQAEESYIRDSYDENVYNMLKEISKGFGTAKAYDMRLEQLQAMYNAYKMVLTSVRNANKSFLNERAGTIEQQAKRCISEVSSVWGKKKEGESDVGRWLRGFHYRNLKPIYLMRAIGSNALTEAYNNLRRGEDTWYRDVQGGREFFLSQSGKYGYGKWDLEKTSTFSDDSGGKVKLTLGQIMSLYAYAKREAAAEHLRIGGVVIEGEAVRVNRLRMKVTYHLNDATSHQIGPETLGKIIGTLTKEQRAFVDAMQDYLSAVMADKGNEVSLAMYGIKLFTEKNYFPIKSAKQFVDQKNEPVGEVKLKNSGFTNKTVPKANNPMVLRGFMDVWADHVNEMSTYHAFVLAIEDFNRIINYQTGRKEGAAPVSLKQTIQNYMGQEAVSAVRELIQSVNGGARVDPAATFVSKAINLFKKNAVFASASVVIQQPSAIVRAAALIDPKYFVGHIIDREKVAPTWEIIKKYAPVAGIKDMGYFDTNMGKSTVDYLKGPEHDGVKDVLTGIVKREKGSFDELLSMAPGYADKVTWCTIWEAVKRETAAKHPNLATRSEEFLKICGDRFTEVITHTQVYDSVFARSGNMRSKDKLMGMATSFMAEPTTAINMIYDAVLQGTRGNKAYMRRAIGAVVGAAVLNAVLKSIVYAERDEDDDETFGEKYVSALVAALKDDVLFLVPNSIPFVRDIMSLVQGYSVERMDMELADDLISAIKKLYSDKATGEEKILGIAGSFGNLLFPAKNMIREVKALINVIDTFRNSESQTAMGLRNAIREGWSGKSVSNAQQLYEARMEGDTAHEERISARYENEKSANSAVVSAIKQAFMDGDLSEEEAQKHLILYGNTDAGDAYWKVKEWIYAKDKGTTDGYGKYNDLYDAILNGGDIQAAVEEFTENGYDEDEVMSNVKSQVGRWFWDEESETRISAEQASDILEKYFGMKQGEIQETILKWSMKKETGISFESLREAYLEQVVSESDALSYLQKYGGMTEYDARERVDDWNFEQEHGYAYDDIKSTYLDDEITRAEAIAVMTEIGGKSRDDAEKKVAYWDYEEKTGVDYENKAQQYKRGIITRQQLRQAMIDLGDYSGEDADIQIEVYDWEQSGLQGASFTRVKNWHEYCEGAGVSKAIWMSVSTYAATAKGDKRSDGSTIPGSKAKKIMEKINSLSVSRSQKDAIAAAIGAQENWSAKTIAKYKLW